MGIMSSASVNPGAAPYRELKAPNRSGRVAIIINAKVKQEGRLIATSPVTERMVWALKRAIARYSPETAIETLAVASLWSQGAQQQTELGGKIYCPLTIQLPPWLVFPQQAVYRACEAVQTRRRWVRDQLGAPVLETSQTLGDCWLPIIWSAGEPQFGAAITEGAMPNAYQHPYPLAPVLREELQTLARFLLENLEAPPSVYLLQFALRREQVIFDRLWPFPAAPALASLNKAAPDLFAYHWFCLSGQPLSALLPPDPEKALP